MQMKKLTDNNQLIFCTNVLQENAFEAQDSFESFSDNIKEV